jgi:hypothetical protein
MSQSVTPPAMPENPTPIQPPALGVKVAPGIESPKALLKRSKEVAREVKRFAKEHPTLTVMYDRKPFPCREIVQFCSACFGVTAMVTSTEEVISDHGQELGYVAVAHAIDATGRVVSGAEAACMYSELDWEGKPSYQLRSMAQTRACSKVLCNLFAYVLRMAGFHPTPAEEMGGPPRGGKREREITTPCYECGNKVSKKRSLETRRKFGKELCLPCEKKLHEVEGEKILEPLNDPKQVAAHVAQVKARKKKASGAQPIVAALDHQDRTEIPA